MRCASNATLSESVDNAMKFLIIISIAITALWIQVLVPGMGVSGPAVKFRHVISIYSDEKRGGLKNPEGVTYGRESRLIVADTGNGRILQYFFQEGEVKPGVREFKIPQLSYPLMTRINSRSEIYALDGKERRIIRMTPGGAFKDILAPQGLPAPASFVPRSFEIDPNDNIYILDIFTGRLLVLDPEGEYTRHMDLPRDQGFFSDFALDTKGDILLIDSVNARVFSSAKDSATFSPLTGNLKEYMRFPTSITRDKRGRIYLVDRNGSSIIILGQDGSFLGRVSGMGWKEGRLHYPSEMCINNRGEVFIADTNNHRIQIFTMVE